MSEPTTSARREQTRRRLFTAAADVFAEVGFDAASVEAICERAGFTRGAFYSNFDSKNDLVLALTSEFSDAKLSRVSARVHELLPGVAGIDELVSRVVDATQDSRTETVLLCEIRTHALRDDALAAAHRALEEQMIARVATLVDEIVRVCGLRLRLPSEEVARLFIEIWSATAMDAAIARADASSVAACLSERTSALARALTDPVD